MTARADTTEGCNAITAVGVEDAGEIESGVLYFDEPLFGDDFCNVSISINGQFQITQINPKTGAELGCLAFNSADADITLDPPSACALDGGAGYPWDRWTAISIEYHSNQLWMFQSADKTADCIAVDPIYYTAFWAGCDTTDHYQWFEWPGSYL
jgi:hypothetical protein